ncbi:MAG: HAMP domain-containing protein, partial [Thermomicrobiales bacterium]|nr:HAMP domain-containing protein [Thermomicrobiales bacterium]
ENQDVLTSLANTPAVRTMDKAQADVVLGQAKELRPSLAGLFLLDLNQQVVSSSGGINPDSFQAEIKSAADVALTTGESAITGKLVVPEGEVEVIAMVSPVLSQPEDGSEGTEGTGTPVGAIGSFISIDRLQRSFLPVAGESESKTSVMLLSSDGIIADQETPNDTGRALNSQLEGAIAEAVAGKRVRINYTDEQDMQRMGVLLPVEYPGAQWAVAVTGPSPANYRPNESLVQDSLIALATAVAATLLLSVIFGELTARPLRRLTTEAAAIAAGDLDNQVEPVGRGEVYSLSLSLRDMANRLTSQVKEVEEAREQTAEQNDLMRELLRRTVRLQEDERRRIAGDIHDAVSPLITGALYRVRALLLTETSTVHTNGNGDSEANEGLVATSELLEQSMDELHNVIFALRPPDLDDVGLEAAVERYVNQINRTGLPSELEVSGELRRLSPEVRLGIYRIIQEALHNALRHAHADEAVVKIEYRDNELRASVRDNGSGFDIESAGRSMSLGLLSMRERAAAIGADLDIVSRPGAGTIVVLRRPWENDLVRPVPETEPDTWADDVPVDGTSANGTHETEPVPEAQNA